MNLRRGVRALLSFLKMHRQDPDDCGAGEQSCGDDIRKRLEELRQQDQPKAGAPGSDETGKVA